jgi:hypothetical protein
VCIDYNNAKGGVGFSDLYFVTYSTTRKRMKKIPSENILVLVRSYGVQFVRHIQEIQLQVHSFAISNGSTEE